MNCKKCNNPVYKGWAEVDVISTSIGETVKLVEPIDIFHLDCLVNKPENKVKNVSKNLKKKTGGKLDLTSQL